MICMYNAILCIMLFCIMMIRIVMLCIIILHIIMFCIIIFCIIFVVSLRRSISLNSLYIYNRIKFICPCNYFQRSFSTWQQITTHGIFYHRKRKQLHDYVYVRLLYYFCFFSRNVVHHWKYFFTNIFYFYLASIESQSKGNSVNNKKKNENEVDFSFSEK